MRFQVNLPVDMNQKDLGAAYKDNTYQYQYNASGNLLYSGRASAGTNSSISGWQVKLLQYDTAANNSVSSILYAQGNADFVYNWTSRSSITFL